MWQSLLESIRAKQGAFDGESGAATETYQTAGGRIHCGRGCRNCCNLAVQCTFPEALAVAGMLDEERASRLDRHVECLRQRIGEVSDLKSYLRLHRKTIGFCPFLAPDGACSVYAARPFACRSLLSTRPADWCAVDFADLHPLERQAYLSSLDPAVVAWPTHYLAAPRDLGREMETAAAWEMHDAFGFSLGGNLPFLVWLERQYRLSEAVARGLGETRKLLEEAGLGNPFLITLQAP